VFRRLGAVVILLLAVAPAFAQNTPADPAAHINALSSFDYGTRMNAARMIRRMPAAQAAPALAQAVRTHADQFVRFRALVLLVGFRDPDVPALMAALASDRNDRIREVVYRWYEQNPDPRSLPSLLAALETEQAEFVRPALIRALAAHGEDPAVQRALVMEAGRGFDFFRSAVIETLGVHHARYAVSTMAPIVSLDGPLQDDAILALGRIGDPAAIPVLAGAGKLPPEVAPAFEAAQCLLGDKCEERIAWLVQTAQAQGRPAVSRAAVSVLGVLAAEGKAAAIDALIGLDQSSSALRGDVAVAFSIMALRRPQESLAWLAKAPVEQRARSVALLHEGFESLEEDFAEEQFFSAARAAYWAAPDASQDRVLMAELIDKLEF
jgi:HEAT repeat protein